MSTTGRRTLAAAITVAAVLIAPSVASAKIFRVSRDVGIYATADKSKLIRTIPPNTRVDVRCYQRGESVDGYAVWDRIRNGNDGFAYVHDKYVEMPNKTGPAANGIVSCDGPPKQPAVGTCAKGDFLTRYLSERLRVLPDHSFTKLTWQPRMCLQNDGWIVRSEPKLTSLAAGNAISIGVELEGVRVDGNTARYHGQIRQCLPFSISYSGLGFSGSGCGSVGTVDISATVSGGRIGTPTFKVHNRSIDEYEWTTRVL
jgi:hypothetical protein